jgi:hypothetical protein
VDDDAPNAAEQIRNGRWILVGGFLVGCMIFAALAYGAWPDATSHTRRDAEVAFLSVIVVGIPLLCVLAVASVPSRRRSKPPGKRVANGLIAAAIVFAVPLEHASWQVVAFAAGGAMLILATVAVLIDIVKVSPEERVRRRQAGLE